MLAHCLAVATSAPPGDLAASAPLGALVASLDRPHVILMEWLWTEIFGISFFFLFNTPRGVSLWRERQDWKVWHHKEETKKLITETRKRRGNNCTNYRWTKVFGKCCLHILHYLLFIFICKDGWFERWAPRSMFPDFLCIFYCENQEFVRWTPTLQGQSDATLISVSTPAFRT